MVSSRNEELMTALINGEDVKDYIPRSRNEQFLKDCAVGSETTTLEPRSRSEMLISEVHNKIKSGSGFDVDLKSVFDQTKSAEYFFSGYNNNYNFLHYIKDLSNSIKYEDTVLIHYDEFKFIDYEKYVLEACENIENNIIPEHGQRHCHKQTKHVTKHNIAYSFKQKNIKGLSFHVDSFQNIPSLFVCCGEII